MRVKGNGQSCPKQKTLFVQPNKQSCDAWLKIDHFKTLTVNNLKTIWQKVFKFGMEVD